MDILNCSARAGLDSPLSINSGGRIDGSGNSKLPLSFAFLVLFKIIPPRNNQPTTQQKVTLNDFPCRHHFQADNKQPYSHLIKLPDGRFRQIRLSGLFKLSGSVPRRGNKHIAIICRRAPAHEQAIKHYIWKKPQLISWHMLCFRAGGRGVTISGSGTAFFRIPDDKTHDISCKCNYS